MAGPPATWLGQALGEVERAGPADVMLEIAGEFLGEGRVVAGVLVGLLEIEDERHQRLGDETAAVDAETAGLVRARLVCVQRFHDRYLRAPLKAPLPR